MISNIITQNITLDTPIMMLTPRQLFDMQREWMANNATESEKAEPPKARYAKTMDELAEALGTSVATCYRMKASGILDEAISQFGRWSIVDIDKAIELMRISNRRGRKKR